MITSFADAFHGWELMFLFNTPPPGLLERAPQLQQIAASFRAAFVAFCKHGKQTRDIVHSESSDATGGCVAANENASAREN